MSGVVGSRPGRPDYKKLALNTIRHDEDVVRLRDLEGLVALTPTRRDLAILDRVGDISEPPEKTETRNRILLEMADIEAVLLDVISRRQQLVQDGHVVIDPDTGEPVPDPRVEREAHRVLREVRAVRSRLAGLPSDDEGSVTIHRPSARPV